MEWGRCHHAAFKLQAAPRRRDGLLFYPLLQVGQAPKGPLRKAWAATLHEFQVRASFLAIAARIFSSCEPENVTSSKHHNINEYRLPKAAGRTLVTLPEMHILPRLPSRLKKRLARTGVSCTHFKITRTKASFMQQSGATSLPATHHGRCARASAAQSGPQRHVPPTSRQGCGEPRPPERSVPCRA